MSYSFIKFNDEIIDSKVMMELTDLTRLLFKDKDVSVSVRKHSYYNPYVNTVYVSTFWKHRYDITELEGFRHDILTRFPSASLFDYEAFETAKDRDILFQQIFLTLEHYRNRIESIRQRPFIKQMIASGDAILLEEYRKQSTNDAESLLKTLNTAVLEYENHFKAGDESLSIISRSTTDSIAITEQIISAAAPRDRLSGYHQIHDMPFNDISAYNHTTPFRKDRAELQSENDENDISHDTGRVDTKTDRDAEDAAMLGETGDNTARKSRHNVENDYDDDVEDYHEGFGRNRGDNRMRDTGAANIHAELLIRKPKIKMTNYGNYRKIYDFYNDLAQKVIGDITKILNFKMNEFQSNRSTGKLMKNPTGAIVSGSHKIFTKKISESKEVDAAFSIILDQSYSMTDHMEECINGIIIINNILKSLGIPQRIVSHHEDSFEIMSDHYPNYLYEHLNFDRSRYYYPVSLLDIEASGDNRDGFIFRHETEILNRRMEKDKFMIIFSDGLPSAEQYNQSGIIDTHEAVNEARKNGINVINIFIDVANEENTRDAIKNIYGQNTVIVENPEEIGYILPNIIERVIKSLVI
ncbi:hypothetical protein WN59_02075 [Salinicoccus sediminis]|uniref:VWFA domain-containing protein n=1 Tax=Salinicoccus sediminis TaxID=1432562 RepID=A0A0M2SPJ6_9STAP|nr:hypothetical protein [Salinicoccus sediminis]KKK35636.1 hypothetical protein WN59_02075 [Salinicoccus sediminis]